MKLYSKIISTLVLTATLSFANCGGKGSGGSDVNGLILSNFVGNLVRSAVSGNCAISVNMSGLYAGVVINIAINNNTVGQLNPALAGLNPVFSGIYSATFPTATSANNAPFDVVAFLDAYGSGGQAFLNQYITGTNNTNALAYATVPYSVKYDTFWRNGTTWTAARRNTVLTNVNTMLQAYAILANASNGANGVNNQAAGIGAAAVAGAAATGTSKAILDASLNAATAGNCANFAAFGPPSVCTTVGGTAIGGLAGIGGFAAINGTAALACARIPRSNCSLIALTTGSRGADISAAETAIGTLLANPDCADKGGQYKSAAIRQQLRGLDPTVTTFWGRNDSITNADTTSNSSAAQILATEQYPKFGRLVALGFGNLMPMRDGNTAYPVPGTAATPDTTRLFYGGSNLSVTTVASCEALGLGKGIAPALTGSALRDLTPVNEIVYALGTNGTAAANYATLGLAAYDSMSYTLPNTFEQIACNTSFRRRTVIPAALGVGTTMPVIQATSGDGGNTSLLSICTYGGTATTRTALRTILNGGLGLTNTGSQNVQDCQPQADARAASGVFGETGLRDFSGALGGTANNSYPNGN